MQTFIDKTIKPVFIIGGIGTADGQDPRPFELGHKSPASCAGLPARSDRLIPPETRSPPLPSCAQRPVRLFSQPAPIFLRQLPGLIDSSRPLRYASDCPKIPFKNPIPDHAFPFHMAAPFRPHLILQKYPGRASVK